jgi:hypothetical protein
MKKITIGAKDKVIVEKTINPDRMTFAIWESVMVEPIIYWMTKRAGKQITRERKIRQGTLMPVTRLCRKPL